MPSEGRYQRFVTQNANFFVRDGDRRPDRASRWLERSGNRRTRACWSMTPAPGWRLVPISGWVISPLLLSPTNEKPKDSAERTRQLEAAAGHYQKAATVTSKPTTKVLALSLLAESFDIPALEQLAEADGNDIAGNNSPNKMLAQFYVRRVTALHKEAYQPQAAARSGERDGREYIVLVAPWRCRLDWMFLGFRRTPRSRNRGRSGHCGSRHRHIRERDGCKGRSVDVDLDDAALLAVRNWHFAPSVVNGEAVGLRINLYVNFTQSTAASSSQTPSSATRRPPR